MRPAAPDRPGRCPDTDSAPHHHLTGDGSAGARPGRVPSWRRLGAASRLALTLLSALLLTAAFVVQVGRPGPAYAATTAVSAQQYNWKNVQIGGGGFVDGIVFNQSRANLVYARTDIGGAYRWDQSTSTWTPLLDWVGFDNWGYNGVVSLASSDVHPDRVYAAVGMYTNSWDPNNGAVLRSSDQGKTWSTTKLPFKLGGNMPGRGMGERLAVDPNDDNVLYLGAPSGNGLWRSTDAGVTWSKVTAFPNPGNYVQDPNDANDYLTDNQGIVWVTFDKSSSSAGSKTKDIYVGVADKDHTVYRSTDGGTTWSAIAGTPTGYIAHKGVLDAVGHNLYIATSDTGGPYDGAKGDVWKYNTQTGTWTQISPIPSSSSDDYFGYSGLTIDRQHPNTIMVATQVSWWPDAIIFRSTDGGATWTRIWDWDGYPNRTTRYTQDISSVPWLTFGSQPQTPEVTPKLGWMNEAVEIDPFNSDRMMYGTGATLYGTTDLTKWDSGGKITIKPMVKGLEETAVLDLISPPSGTSHLLSALGDIGGFKHDDLDTVPSLMYTQPNYTSTTGMDFAELSPSTVVRAGNISKDDNPNVNRAAFSTDAGANWFQASGEPSGVTAGGTIAEGADAKTTVWAPEGAAVSYSTAYGSSWTASSGIPNGAQVRSDRANGTKFYGFSGGSFYASTDSGAHFTKTAASGLPSSGTVAFHAVPGHEGDIWLAGGKDDTYGLWHSTDSGATFTKVSGVDEADNIGFGAAAPGKSYPALYSIAEIGGVRGVFRSDDAGASWTRINDDQHQYGNIGQAITGDPRVYGRVYLGTNGRGILYADPASGSTTPPPTDTTAQSAPTGLTVSGTTAASVSLTWSASTDAVGVTGYDVYRGGTKVGSSTSTSFTDTGLSPTTSYSYTVRAKDAAGNVSAASASVTAVTQPASGGGDPGTGSGTVKVRYKNNDTAPGNAQIMPGLQVVNTGSSALDLSKVTLRYYFTSDGGASSYNTAIDYAALGSGNVTTKVVAISTPKTGADHYLEVGFTSGAGSLAAGASTSDIQARFGKADWSAFDETNDYSYATNTAYADVTKVTAYVNGTLVGGIEP